MTDNAVYPVLIAKYLSTVLHIPDTTSVEYYLLLMGVVLLLAFVNFLGLKVVGNTSMVSRTIACNNILEVKRVLAAVNATFAIFALTIVLGNTRNTAQILCVVCLLPFAVMVVMGIPNVDVHRWMDRPVADEVLFSLVLQLA